MSNSNIALQIIIFPELDIIKKEAKTWSSNEERLTLHMNDNCQPKVHLEQH